jgi:muconolactone delta-isomerase
VKEMTMEFLVDMVTRVPDGTTDAEVDAIPTREAARSRELAAQGHLLRLWRPPLEPAEWRTWGPFQAADTTELESVLSSMPLRVWRHDTVTPLTAHPSDPDRGDVTSNQTSAYEADMLDAVLTQWKAAVDTCQSEHVAALFTTDAIFRGPRARRSVQRPGCVPKTVRHAIMRLGVSLQLECIQWFERADRQAKPLEAVCGAQT